MKSVMKHEKKGYDSNLSSIKRKPDSSGHALFDSSPPPAVRKSFVWTVGCAAGGGKAHRPHIDE
jgi:hypothetical protein